MIAEGGKRTEIVNVISRYAGAPKRVGSFSGVSEGIAHAVEYICLAVYYPLLSCDLTKYPIYYASSYQMKFKNKLLKLHSQQQLSLQYQEHKKRLLQELLAQR